MAPVQADTSIECGLSRESRLGQLAVPALPRSRPQVGRWIDRLLGDLHVDGRGPALRQAVFEACENAFCLDPDGSVVLTAFVHRHTLTVEVLARADYEWALCHLDGPRRREGFGFRRMVDLVDEVTIRRRTPGGALVRLSLHLSD
jgi:hypothetical protein